MPAFTIMTIQEKMVLSLVDNIKDRVAIDLLRINGGDFISLDKRLLSLYLVKHKLTRVAMFDVNQNSIHASEFFIPSVSNGHPWQFPSTDDCYFRCN